MNDLSTADLFCRKEVTFKSNKNAFQLDAYRLLVARISQPVPAGGVCVYPVLGGVYLPGGCTWS